jgi:HSP20 family protein
MTLVRWEPRGIFGLRHEIDRLFDRYWQRQEPGEAFPTTAWTPTVDISEHEDAFKVKADLPGLSRDDIKLRITGNVLTISGERKSEKTEGANGQSYHRVERVYGSFSRSFSLPSAVDEGEVAAQFKDGVLTVTLPKSKAALPKEIKVS